MSFVFQNDSSNNNQTSIIINQSINNYQYCDSYQHHNQQQQPGIINNNNCYSSVIFNVLPEDLSNPEINSFINVSRMPNNPKNNVIQIISSNIDNNINIKKSDYIEYKNFNRTLQQHQQYQHQQQQQGQFKYKNLNAVNCEPFEIKNLNPALDVYSILSEDQYSVIQNKSPKDSQLGTQFETQQDQEKQKTVKNKVKKNSSSYETCKVCSKESEKIIFAYNMQICEACKKFYQRAINKTEGKQYVGGKVQNCNQFKKTLEEQLDEYKCKKYSDSPSKQYFRLKKCIEIKMQAGTCIN